jgi:hypothetical protein
VLRHGRCVCPYCNLAQWQCGFRDILQHASGIGRSGRTMKPSPKISLLDVCLCTPVPVPLYGCRSMGMYHVCAHLS